MSCGFCAIILTDHRSSLGAACCRIRYMSTAIVIPSFATSPSSCIASSCTRTELAKSFIISVLSVLERISLNRSSVGCSVMRIYIDNSLHPVSYYRGHGLDRDAGSRCPHHTPVKVIQPTRTVGAV